MKNLNLIAAIGQNNELGKNNNLIWHLPEDLKFFKEKTMGKSIVMGRKTFESLPKLLPNRNHIVLTNKVDYFVDNVVVINDFNNLLKYLEELKEEIYIIGGAQIYSQFINYVESMYLTEVQASEINADAFFPNFDKTDWERVILDEKNEEDIKYKHMLYKRKQ